jgi:hypothetical protein
MLWRFSKSEERHCAVRMVREVKVARDQRPATGGYGHRLEMDMDHGAGSYGHPHEAYDHHGPPMRLPSLVLSLSSSSHTSTNVMYGHGTGTGTWSTYTPPGSTTTLSNSPSTSRGPPSYPVLRIQCVGRYKSEPGSAVATRSGEFFFVRLDPFTYSVPVGDTACYTDQDKNLTHLYPWRRM